MKKINKIAHLTSVHPRYDTRIFSKECRSLAQEGYDVSLVVADGRGNEIIDGVKIYDVGANKGRLHRMIVTPRKVYKKAKELKCDIYHFHDPELMYCGLRLKKRGANVLYDIHEDMVQQIKIKYWIPKFLRNLISHLFKNLENRISKKMDALIVPQPYMELKYLEKNKKTVLIENFVMIDEQQSRLKTNYNNRLYFHAGALTEERGLLNMVRALGELQDPSHLFLAGNIKEEMLKHIQKEKGWEKVTYLGILPHEQIQDYYNKSSLGLILYNNVGQYYLSYAVKLFEYMVNAIPVIMPNFGEWVTFNKENDCGINVNPTNPKEVAQAITYLNNNVQEKERLGHNGRKRVFEKYNWKIAETKLLKLYEDILSQSSP